MITRPTCPTSASTPHAGEHETLVAHAAHLIAELEPHCRYTPASTSPGLDVGEHDRELGPGPLDTS
jgi:hypothetical protein